MLFRNENYTLISILFLSLVLTASCREITADGGLSDDGQVTTDGGDDDATPPEDVITHETRTVTDCAGLSTGTENCSYSYRHHSSACDYGKCDKLVIFFSGGQMTCPDSSNTTSFMADFADRGYVAVCVKPYDTSTGSGTYPHQATGPRISLVVETITQSAEIQALWTGENLLFSGISFGASAPVARMAQSTDDDSAAWKGTNYTAACFYDGSYSPTDLMTFLKGNSCSLLSSVLSYQRAYQRYCTWTGGLLPASWPSVASCNTSAKTADDIVSTDAGNFAIADWKLIECGDTSDACLNDVHPAGPIHSLCNNIDAEPGHTCDYESHPSVSHLNCVSVPETETLCAEWFESKIPH